MASKQEWAQWAVEGIILPKERESARQELLDHMDDHIDALLSMGFPKYEAEQQAVLAMGSPEETAKLLRRAHQPILTRILQICRWTVILLAAALALQLAVSLFDAGRGVADRLWCDDPETLYGYDYFSAGPEELPENVFARRVADTEGSVDLGDYQLQTLKAALDRTEEGTRVTLLLEANADHLWYGNPRMHGTLTAACGGETTSREILWRSHFRRLRRHYIYAVAQFEGDLLAEQALTLHFTNGERSFTLPVTLKGGDVYEN